MCRCRFWPAAAPSIPASDNTAARLRPRGIHYVDAGTSGGIWGAERGYCLMIGGPGEAVKRLDPIFKALAPGRGNIPRTPGREKAGGAPLTYADEHDAPDYAADPEGKRVPLTAHIRLANPRTPGTQANRILRRSYNYSRGLTNAGQLDMGLMFVCFQADLAAGFLAVQSRLNGERLEEYIKPAGGGYFFVLPGVQSKDGFLAEGLLRAVA